MLTLKSNKSQTIKSNRVTVKSRLVTFKSNWATFKSNWATFISNKQGWGAGAGCFWLLGAGAG